MCRLVNGDRPSAPGFPVICIAIVAAGLSFPANAQNSITISVVEGQGSINNVRARTARAPVVELRDAQGKPLAAVPVTFMTPETGPSAVFGTDRMLVTQSDANGRAYGLGIHPNAIPGEFEIRVTASYRNAVATAVIRQINAAPEEAKSSRKAIWIAAIAGGAAAAGIFAAMHGSSGSAPAQTFAAPSTPVVSSSPVLTAGSSTFGPPQ